MSYAYIGYLYIKHGYFQRGFGRNLMNFVVMKAKLENFSEIRLFVNEKADWARQAYDRMGFKIMASTPEAIFAIDENLKPYYETGNILVHKVLPRPNQTTT